MKDVSIQQGAQDRGPKTHVHRISPVILNKITKMAKDSTLGINETTRRNFAKPADVHALSRYLPP
jgi:hypothetical protein